MVKCRCVPKGVGRAFFPNEGFPGAYRGRKLVVMATYHCFLSHAWGKGDAGHRAALELASKLRSQRFRVWVDEERMKGDIVDAMVAGIDSSSLVIVAVTKDYMDKVNSPEQNNVKREFTYALAKKGMGRVVPVVMEKEMLDQSRWEGRFLMEMSGQMYADFSSQDVEKAAQLVQRTLEAASVAGPEIERHIEGASMHEFNITFDRTVIPMQKAREYLQGTRKWVFEAMYAFMMSKQSQVFVLIGVAGIGKSVILARLAQIGGAFEGGEGLPPVESLPVPGDRKSLLRASKQPRWTVGAYHFFRHDDKRTASGRSCFESIADQLQRTVPGFADQLRGKDFSDIQDLADLFRQLLVEPFTQLKKPKKFDTVAIIIDALDECAPGNRRQVLELLQNWEREFAPWLKLVLSTRPEDYIPFKLRQFDPTELNTEDVKNMEDMRSYFYSRLSPLMNKAELKEGVEVMEMKSEGLFLYARLFEDILARLKVDRLTVADLKNAEQFPAKLDGVYTQYFRRLLAALEDSTVYQVILSPLCVTRAPMTLVVLQEILNVETNNNKRAVKALTNKAKQLLFVSEDAVRFVHKSMRDWLVDDENPEDELVIDPKEGHGLLAEYCLRHPKSSFSIRSAIYHLKFTPKAKEAEKLLQDPEWLLEALRMVPAFDIVLDAETLDAPSDDTVALTRGLEKSSAGILRQPDQVFSQLRARLPREHPMLKPMKAFERKALKGRKSLVPVKTELESALSPLRKTFTDFSKGAPKTAVWGDRLATGGGDGLVQLFDLTTGKRLFRVDVSENGIELISNRSGGVWCLAMSSQYIAVGFWDSTVRLFNHTGDLLPQTIENEVAPRAMCFTDSFLSVAGSDKLVRSFDFKSKKSTPATFHQGSHTEMIFSLAGSPVGPMFATASYHIFLWNVSQVKFVRKLEGHDSPVNALCFTEDGKMIASGTREREVVLWDVVSGDELFSLTADWEILSISIFDDCVFSTTMSSYVLVHSLESRALIRKFDTAHADTVRSIEVSDEFLVTSSDDEMVRIFSREEVMAPQRGNDRQKAHERYVTCMRIFDGKVYSSSADKTVKIWDLKTGELLKSLDGPEDRHIGGVYSLALNEKFLVSGGGFHREKDVIKVRDRNTLEMLYEIKDQKDRILDLKIYGGNMLFASSDDGLVQVFDIEKDGKRLHSIQNEFAVNSVVYSENHGIVVMACNNGLVTAYSLKRRDFVDGGTMRHEIPMGKNQVPNSGIRGMKMVSNTILKKVRSVAFDKQNPDHIMSCGFDNRLKVWDAKTFQLVRKEEIPRPTRNSAALYADAAATEVESNELHIDFIGHKESNSVGFTVDTTISWIEADSAFVVAGTQTGHMHILRKDKH